jgi:hypothetical protein
MVIQAYDIDILKNVMGWTLNVSESFSLACCWRFYNIITFQTNLLKPSSQTDNKQDSIDSNDDKKLEKSIQQVRFLILLTDN